MSVTLTRNIRCTDAVACNCQDSYELSDHGAVTCHYVVDEVAGSLNPNPTLRDSRLQPRLCGPWKSLPLHIETQRLRLARCVAAGQGFQLRRLGGGRGSEELRSGMRSKAQT
eukprot:3940832-Rhodomonas_salina.1